MRSRGFFFRSNPENKGSGITSQEHLGGGFLRSPVARWLWRRCKVRVTVS